MNIISKIKHRRRINRAVRELSALSNETLRDIGVERANIAHLVEQMMRDEMVPGTAAVQRSVKGRHHPLPDGAAA